MLSESHVSSYVSHQHHGPYVEEYIEDSLKSLETEYVDLVGFVSCKVLLDAMLKFCLVLAPLAHGLEVRR